MSIMMIFLVASMLSLVALVLAFTIYLSKSKRLGNTSSRSRAKRMQSDSSVSGDSACQTCHLCGGLRLRTRNAAFLDDCKAIQSPIRRLDDGAGGQSKSTQHQWAAMRTQTILSIKEAVQKLISNHKKQARTGFLRKLSSLGNFLRGKTSSHSRDMCVTMSECSTDCSTCSHLGSSVEGTNSDAITGAARTEIDKVVAQDTQQSTDIVPQDAPVHRVVLEILVSPSGNSKGNSGTSSPGLTLKLETSGTLEHLAGCLEALKNKDVKKCEHNAEIAQVSRGATDALPETSGSGCAHGDQASQRLSQILKEANLLPKDEINSTDIVNAKLEPVNEEPILESISLNKGCQALTGLKDCAQCGHIMNNYADCDRTFENKEEVEMASGVLLHNLGSLHISFRKSSGQEGNANVNCQAGSMLASLNVTDKLVSMKKEKFNNKPCVLSDASCSLKSALIEARESESVCNENLVKEEDHCSFPGSPDTPSMYGFNLLSKKGKKKKKNRGKKPKVNGDSSVVADAKEIQELGKIALEAAKHVSAVPERELGCVCGAMKGNLHNESCPYPFTSSGSMLQRKMREQYNHLVRSNAAKTLTLAQVGQFTSCLVEAKATLRQKSESIQRKFTISKSLLSKADKSSFDRLCGQIYGLEMEQKKLEEDTIVYNRLQEQLKLSPAYQKMLEYGRAHFELQPQTGQMIEKLEPEDSEMSFEEFLEQEKKDAFWQRRNLVRPAVSTR